MSQTSREQEAGALYEEGSRHVRAGGDELHFIANHLAFMVRGTAVHKGPLWQSRILHDGREIRLEQFIDYLMKPTRVGLGLPSLHFLRQVLKATPGKGEEALALVRAELTKEGIDLDAAADREHQRELNKRTPPLAKHGTNQHTSGPDDIRTDRGNAAAYLVAKLKRDAPEIAARLAAGEFRSARAAAIEAGLVKPVDPLTAIRRIWNRTSPAERAAIRAWLAER